MQYLWHWQVFTQRSARFRRVSIFVYRQHRLASWSFYGAGWNAGVVYRLLHRLRKFLSGSCRQHQQFMLARHVLCGRPICTRNTILLWFDFGKPNLRMGQCEGDLCTLLVLFDTFCHMHKGLFFGYKRTAPTWIGPERHVKNHSKDYQQSMTILTLQHVCSRDKYVTNPQRKPQKHSLCGKVQDNRTSVV